MNYKKAIKTLTKIQYALICITSTIIIYYYLFTENDFEFVVIIILYLIFSLKALEVENILYKN